jgi:hypothetical protein
MLRAVVELVRDDEFERAVFFLERADGGDGDDALDAELLKTVNIGAEIQFGWKQAMTAPVAGKESNFASSKSSQDVGIGRIAKRSGEFYFLDIGYTGHGVEPATANDAYFRLRQSESPKVFG